MFLVIHSHAKTTHETADEIPGAKKITEQIYLVHGNALLPFHLQINYNDASFHPQNNNNTTTLYSHFHYRVCQTY